MSGRLPRWAWILAAPVALVCGFYLVIFAVLWRRFAAEDCRVAVLMFHQILPASHPELRYAMSDTVFARQIAVLAAAGATTRSPDELVAALQRGRQDGCPFRSREVLITFDMDGESRQAELALPVLRQNGFKAVFFVPTAFIDHGLAVSSSAIRTLAAAGMTIGSHSEHHYDMRSEQPDPMVASLGRSRDVLHALTGQPIDFVAAPGGRYNAEAIDGVRRAGFAGFFNSDPCYITPESSRWQLCRIEVRGDGGLSAVDALTRPRVVAAEATAWWLKRGLEDVIGARAFRWVHKLSQRV